MFRNCIFALLTFLLPMVGNAASCTHLYMRGFAGVNVIDLPEFNSDEVIERLETDIGYIVGGAVGYHLSGIFRIETEFAYRCNTLDQLVVNEEDVNLALVMDGGINSYAYMLNAIFDIPIKFVCTPYVGFGIGGTAEQGHGRFIILEDTPQDRRFKYKRNAAAYQMVAGFNIISLFSVNGSIEYHYFDLVGEENSNPNHSLSFCLRNTF